MPDVSNLATKIKIKYLVLVIQLTKTDYSTKVTEIENKLNNRNHDKYIDTQEFNACAADVFNVRLAQANLVRKTDFDAKLSSLNRKITSNKTKHVLVENELKKLKTFDLIYFIGKSHFEQDRAQNYLVLQPMYRYFKLNTNTLYTLSWKSKGLSNENINPPNTRLSPLIDYVGNQIRVKFTGSCLKQSDKISCTHKTIVNIYIIDELGASASNDNDPTLKIVYLVQLL